MKPEIEVKILNINVKKIEKRLAKIGAKKIMARNMRRHVYYLKPGDYKSWIRLRDMGDKVMLAVKKMEHNGIDGTKELEIKVDDFEKTDELIRALGFRHKSYQETKRISYKLGEVEIEIDFWPIIEPYLEIEAKSVKAIEEVVGLLGYQMSDTTSIGVMEIYKRKGIDLNIIKDLKIK